MKTLGTIVATDTRTGLKVIFHVVQEDAGMTFRRPEIDIWCHTCDPAMTRTTEGFFHELATVEAGRFQEPEFFELKTISHHVRSTKQSDHYKNFDPDKITDQPGQSISQK